MYSSDDDEESENAQQIPKPPYTIVALCLFLLSWQATFRVPDNCVGGLLAFLHHFLLFLSAIILSTQLSSFAKNLPKNVEQLRLISGINVDTFVKFVVCPLCHSIYDHDACLGRARETKHCQHVPFPDHPHASFRKPCQQPLMKLCKTKSTTIFRPFKVYCHQSIVKSLELLLCRPNFLQNCEQWRYRQIDANILGDIYDGKVWKEFLDVNGKHYFNEQNMCSLAFSLNIDWFQPYKHVTDSVGAIYLSILNLPRQLRYKVENIILCGIIPGPSEPKDVNSYFYPIVHELLQLWEGIVIKTNHNQEIKIRGALLCTTSDLPATRKLCGFAGHSASIGCSKCLKQFPNRGDKLDYSGYEREQWPKRDLEAHRRAAEEYRKAKTKAQQDSLLRKAGVRYSVLLMLPYFDVVRYHVIDAMHNLLLGTAKNVTRIWCESGLLSSNDLQKIQQHVNAINVPLDIGRIPSNIASSFHGFTADQWRSWTCIYSPVLLKNVLSPEHLRCWLLFVKATSMLCTRTISIHDVKVADSFLTLFCKEFEKLYGPHKCTPNMHLHLHLCDCVLDYGPVYSFWCFAFERYNGILGSYPTNSRQIEPQIMKKFIQQQQVESAQMPSECSSLSLALSQDSHWNGSLLDSMSAVSTGAIELRSLSQSRIGTCDYQLLNPPKVDIELIPPRKQYVLTCDQIQDLTKMYSMLYPTLTITHIQRVCIKVQKVRVAGEMVSSVTGNNSRNCCISAVWKTPEQNDSNTPERRIGNVQYILKNTITTGHGKMEHVLAVVTWYKIHPEEMYFGSSCYVVRSDMVVESSMCYIPVQRLLSRCCFGPITIDLPSGKENVIVAIPISFKFCV